MLDFSNVHVGISHKGKGINMKSKTIFSVICAAIVTTVCIMAMYGDNSDTAAKVTCRPATKRAIKKAVKIESAFSIGKIQGWPIMIFIAEDSEKTNAVDRLESHVAKGIARILSYNKISAPPSDCTLTLFTCSGNGYGWNMAYPTASDKMDATNALMTSALVPVKEMTSLPDGCMVALGWLCYVTNGFWSAHTEPVSFSDLANLKGGWLYRDCSQ